ncbi:MAG: molybdate ABC transporter substrate-binding protein [Planctomycetes bacterium]|nr:molybdate ABC transporter substrate-binding protein [Planctomycetota bacterium]
MSKRCLLFAGAALALVAGCERSAPARKQFVVVFAAASVADVLRDAGERFKAKSGFDVAFNFGSSSALAKQIKARAYADIFISADRVWMDDLAAAGAIRVETRRDLLANRLVVIAPAGAEFALDIAKEFDFAARLPGVRRIAAGDPAHVPAGRYARQALEALGWWEALEPKLVPAQDVRAALRLVEIGEADAGIVYATDAKRSDKVRVVAVFPAALHEPIRYPMALCTDSPAAAEFAQFLRGDEMSAVFAQAGFEVVPMPEGR